MPHTPPPPSPCVLCACWNSVSTDISVIAPSSVISTGGPALAGRVLLSDHTRNGRRLADSSLPLHHKKGHERCMISRCVITHSRLYCCLAGARTNCEIERMIIKSKGCSAHAMGSAPDQQSFHACSIYCDPVTVVAEQEDGVGHHYAKFGFGTRAVATAGRSPLSSSCACSVATCAT